jgi:response regulator RpfG family c-di-GMP phosphodiesterase
MAEKQLGSNSFLQLAKEISLTHHEKWDGSGYPNQLSGADIPISGRLMAIADVYDALISERVYKKAFSHEKAKSIILEGNGQHFDPELVDAFIAIEEQFVAIADKYRNMERAENEMEMNKAS